MKLLLRRREENLDVASPHVGTIIALSTLGSGSLVTNPTDKLIGLQVVDQDVSDDLSELDSDFEEEEKEFQVCI